MSMDKVREVIARELQGIYGEDPEYDDNVDIARIISALHAASHETRLALIRALMPEVYAVVPREATVEMRVAGSIACEALTYSEAADLYAAMIAAAEATP